MTKGLFIAVEGPDGSGKTTAIHEIKRRLEEKGHEVVLTREPGGTPIGEKIREILLDNENTEMADTTEALLYAAARAQHVQEKINPLIASGKTVITDRYFYSSLAYQGYGRGLGIETIMSLSKFAISGTYPDKVLFFDITPETALSRKYEQGEVNRMEEQGENFHSVTYDGYQQAITIFNEGVARINANGTPEETVDNCMKALSSILE